MIRPAWLLNENIPLQTAHRLRASGWDVAAISELAAGVTDAQVMQMAVEQKRWLVTFDRDYGELIFRLGLPAPAVTLLLRVASYKPEEPALWMAQLYDQGQLVEGNFHRFDGETLRRRPYPQH